MLDFLLQTFGILIGIILGSALYGTTQALVIDRMGDSTLSTESETLPWFLRYLSPLSVLSMLFFHVGWSKGNTFRPQATSSPRTTALVSFLLPLASIFFSALLLTTLLKTLGQSVPQAALLLESTVRTLLTIAITTSLPIPPLEGWRALSVLTFGEIQQGHKQLFPVLLILAVLLELFTNFSIIDLVFGPLVDNSFFFLYLIV